jgi:hypothetical protein
MNKRISRSVCTSHKKQKQNKFLKSPKCEQIQIPYELFDEINLGRVAEGAEG